MGDTITKPSPLIAWFDLWADFERARNSNLNWANLKKQLTAFQVEPSRRNLENVLVAMRPDGAPARPFNLFEENARNLWMRSRAERLGIWNPSVRVPRIFFNAQNFDEDTQMLIAPARPDSREISFRAATSRIIADFILGNESTETRSQRIFAAFAHNPAELRTFVMPLFAKNFEAQQIPWTYLHMHSRSDQGQRRDLPGMNIPVDHLRLNEAGMKQALRDLRNASGVLILDFLDFVDWFEYNPKQWLFPYKKLVEIINENFLTNPDNRLFVTFQGDALSHKVVWKKLLLFIRLLSIDQPNIAGIGLYPQFMSEEQVARYLNITPADAALMATRVPLLANIVLQIKEAITKRGKQAMTFEDALKDIVKKLSGVGALIYSRSDVDSVTPQAAKRISDAFIPPVSDEFAILAVDEEIEAALPPNGSGRITHYEGNPGNEEEISASENDFTDNMLIDSAMTFDCAFFESAIAGI